MRSPAKQRSAPNSASRRRFLLEAARTGGGVVLFSLGLGMYARKSASQPPLALRPPGALDEEKFTGACIRCGLCVRDCPFDSLKLARLEDDVATGTPYFIARDIPCEMCEDIPCVVACPTGALDHDLDDIDDARMGLAVLIDQENCLNMQGLRCDVCYRICPAIDTAITLELEANKRSGKHAIFIPTVHSEHCTGCGKCERACVLEEAAIKVLPLQLAKGELGHHYRWGWKEKDRAGSSLVAPDQQHRYNLPEGQRYDYENRGLIYDDDTSGESTPFADDPLSTLNRGIREAK